MGKYTEFDKHEFEKVLNDTIIQFDTRLRFYTLNGRDERFDEVLEYVYILHTGVSWINIIIFSSIDIHSNKCRPNGKDRVRVVLEWEYPNVREPIYKSIGKFKRTEKMLNRLSTLLTLTLAAVHGYDVSRSSSKLFKEVEFTDKLI